MKLKTRPPKQANFNETRKVFNWIGDKLGISKQEDWYRYSGKDVKTCGSEKLLIHQFNGSLYFALQSVYPEFKWNPLSFQSVPRNHWRVQKNQREMMDWIGDQLQVEKQEDWYSLSVRDVLKTGAPLSKFYNNSLIEASKNLYPEYDWFPWLFKKTHPHFLGDKDNLKKYAEWITERLGIKTKQQWLSVSRWQLIKKGGRPLLRYFGNSLKKTLESISPHVDQNSEFVSEGEKSTYEMLTSLLDTNIFTHYRFLGPDGFNVELDFYVPSLSIAIEYQGGAHYVDFWKDSLIVRQTRDRQKRELCVQRGITLIEIPYRWDNSAETLSALIRKHRPDIQFALKESTAAALNNSPMDNAMTP